MKSTLFHKKDSVIVKSGVTDPDLGLSIAGWQGTITAVMDDDLEPEATVRWDSLTLENMPEALVDYYRDNALDNENLTLPFTDLEFASPRETPVRRKKTQAKTTDSLTTSTSKIYAVPTIWAAVRSVGYGCIAAFIIIPWFFVKAFFLYEVLTGENPRIFGSLTGNLVWFAILLSAVGILFCYFFVHVWRLKDALDLKKGGISASSRIEKKWESGYRRSDSYISYLVLGKSNIVQEVNPEQYARLKKGQAIKILYLQDNPGISRAILD
jgi:hypothetical protein